MNDQATVAALQRGWTWVPNWVDSAEGTAGRLVTFRCSFNLRSVPEVAVIHCTADTRYKLSINGQRVTVGPTRSSDLIWYFDTIDIARFLQEGDNNVVFQVIRYFATARGAFPFARTLFPGLTVVGAVGDTDIGTENGQWTAAVNDDIRFPMGLVDDVFLHINERGAPIAASSQVVQPQLYRLKTVTGDQAPWRLRPRLIPLPTQLPARVDVIRDLKSSLDEQSWQGLLQHNTPVSLPPNSTHRIDIQAECHSTAFLRWVFRCTKRATIRLKTTYSEGYELEPRLYPWVRRKADRLDSSGQLLGPFDEVTLTIAPGADVAYEPFWFRTFRLIRLELDVGDSEVEFASLSATQTNYPLDVKSAWNEPKDQHSDKIWDVCIRTLRNCMFDGYSDCPFYEQLQYAGDTRSVGLFHYYLSGDDRLMRQAIVGFAASMTPDGLTQSRYPSHVPQVIAGFSLFWALSLCDHMMFFGDAAFIRPLLPLVDRVLEFYHSHIDDLGLVSGIPSHIWQYVDWVTAWEAADDHADKGVPTAGRTSNRHTFFSLLYAYVLRCAGTLSNNCGRSAVASDYIRRADDVVAAVNKHCYDSNRGLYTDSTSDITPPTAYSQHCQVFAVLSGAASEPAPLIRNAFHPNSTLGKCSYVMMFYAFRAFAIAGVYDEMYRTAWDPWRAMLAKNLSTWQEDDVRERSDCHAWGSVPVYEYCSEVAGLQPIAAGWTKVQFAPRLGLSEELEARVVLGKNNVATVKWKVENGAKVGTVVFDNPADVVSDLPGEGRRERGVVSEITFQCSS